MKRTVRSGGLGSGWGAASGPTNVSAWVRTERDQTLRPRRPAEEAINPHRLTDARRQERSTPVNGRVPSSRRDQPRLVKVSSGRRA